MVNVLIALTNTSSTQSTSLLADNGCAILELAHNPLNQTRQILSHGKEIDPKKCCFQETRTSHLFNCASKVNQVTYSHQLLV